MSTQICKLCHSLVCTNVNITPCVDPMDLFTEYINLKPCHTDSYSRYILTQVGNKISCTQSRISVSPFFAFFAIIDLTKKLPARVSVV